MTKFCIPALKESKGGVMFCIQSGRNTRVTHQCSVQFRQDGSQGTRGMSESRIDRHRSLCGNRLRGYH
jgi:hypothetical protein